MKDANERNHETDCAADDMLNRILSARERRADVQRGMLAEFGRPLISFTLNIAGARKTFPLAQQAFSEGKLQIARQLEREGIPVAVYREIFGDAGSCGIWALDADPVRIKKLAISIEEGSGLGRLFDIDVLRADGSGISRRELGLPMRKCLICGAEAHACARNQKHPVEELIHRTEELLRDYFDRRFADQVAGAALRALMYEVSVTPKPGLVDRNNNGAHRNMDFFKFIDSCSALVPYFHAFTMKGMRLKGTPGQLFQAVRYTGQAAEDAMFAATGGVNTHKGAIYSLGLICAAAGRLHRGKKKAGPGDVTALCSEMAKVSLKELEEKKSAPETHGEAAFSRYGFLGVKGEAANGFPSVIHVAFPVLRGLLKQGVSYNDAGAVTLLHLIATVEDTNIAARTEKRTYAAVRRKVQNLIDSVTDTDGLLCAARRLDGEFIALNISAGGCADLLAIAFMLVFLYQPD